MDETLNIPGVNPKSTPVASDSANYPDQAAAARARLEALFGAPMPTAAPAATVAPVATTPAEQFALPGAAPAAPTPGPVTVTPPVQPSAAATKRKLPSRVRPIATAVGAFIVLLLLFKMPIYINQFRFASQAPVQSEPLPVVTASVPADPIINIPKINATAPIVFEPSFDEAKIQRALQDGVVHYGSTPRPGDPGNSVIVGHSSNDWWEPGKYKYVFILLDKLVPGDTFSVNYNSKQYIYQVTEILVVAPTDLSVLASTSEPTMTLITCTPPGTTWKRLVVKSKQISPKPVLTNTKATTNSTGILPGNAPSMWDKITNWWSGLFGKDNNNQAPASLPGT